MSFDVPHAITTRIRANLAEARARVEAVLKEQGFGVLTEIDVQATLKKKLQVDTPPYLILGACNPQLAHRALSQDASVGLLLPCNVVLTVDGDEVVVSAASPKAMFDMMGPASALSSIAEEAEAKIRRAMDALSRA